ncbi:hypothetical protein B0T14DRAFT_519034 [Immersiella caudata]|uniref:Uncharacterized protein n=1 Tax=Immersiella caudata TaxID=314043 RepID=A0AA40BZN3_9PEZI|nr:hypothetical protein B0T14DRAFT_519034 [Immersiella caudata]
MRWMSLHSCPIAGISALDFSLLLIFHTACAVVKGLGLFIIPHHAACTHLPRVYSSCGAPGLFVMGGWQIIIGAHFTFNDRL